MWRLIRASFSIVVTMIGIVIGVLFIEHNREVVNVQFPLVARESGEVPLGLALIVASAVGVGVALLIAFAASMGMSLYAARLKREIKALRREVDSLRNLPLLDEEIERETDDEDGEDIVATARSIDVIPDGPVRGGSTAAHVGGDDDDVDDDPDSEEGEIDAPKPVPDIPSGTRKLDVT